MLEGIPLCQHLHLWTQSHKQPSTSPAHPTNNTQSTTQSKLHRIEYIHCLPPGQLENKHTHTHTQRTSQQTRQTMWKPGDSAPASKKQSRSGKKSRKRQRQDDSAEAADDLPAVSSSSLSSESKSTTPKPLSASLSSLRFMSRVTERVAKEKAEQKAENEEHWVVPRNALLGVNADGGTYVCIWPLMNV
jgi:hypothetical protein